MTDAQPTYDRATSAYDKDHERALMEAITRTIFETSAVSDADAIVIRTAECAQALVIVLAGVLAMSPAATRSPTAIRRTIDDLGKRLRRQSTAAETSEDLQEFIRRMRRILPQRRRAETFTVVHWDQPFVVTVGFFDDGTPGEVFIDGCKTGQDVQSTARDAAVVLSLALQHGTPIEVIRRAVTRSGAGEAASIPGAIADRLPEIARGAA